ncbi:MAG: hypothetical protein DI586_00745 [Micavibrio aeruginosavorus]|uniref:Uncharacterized protein n=1 Tax=Micavibrio aeruginosavorus TaxID=349221 RepID=A0A2W5FMZ7_9BACT|nr:MAG: hypothetical protein DI586_00745 [Micavibrio aeruginosavorus]
MIRGITFLSFLIISGAAIAADNGGFGSAFTNKAPSALMESPQSQIAQSVQIPSADDLQNIMPAAGDEEPPSVDDISPDKTRQILDTAPTATHDEIPEQ